MSKSSVVLGSNKPSNIWIKLDKRVQAKGGTPDALDLLDKPEGESAVERIAEIIVEEEMRTRNSFQVPFTPGLSWKDRIERCKFDVVDQEVWQYIDKFIAVQDEDPAAVNVSPEHYNRYMSSSDAEKEMAKVRRQGISAARFLHLCELFPALQRQSPLVCLKVVCTDRHGDGRVFCADVDVDGRRGLWLDYRNDGWGGSCRFPSVPQEPSKP